MDISRILEKPIELQIGKQKVILLYGTRRVRKTTLICKIAEKHKKDVLLMQGKISR